MKRYYLIFCLWCITLPLQAQNTVEEVLQLIASNNKTLQAGAQLNSAQKLEARSGNYLSNPTIELNQLWADHSSGGNVNELAVVQSFDFPSVYRHKNKLKELKISVYDQQLATTRQQILLTAQQTCYEIIYLRKRKNLLNERLENAQNLWLLYQKKLKEGDANQLELNKVQLELLNAQNETRQNNAMLAAQEEHLQNLNGGIPLNFKETEYPALVLPNLNLLETEYLQYDPNLKELNGQSEIAEREIRLSRAQTFPKFDLGYRRNGGSGEKLNGFRIGMSIPLWENKNTVKKAKAQYEYTASLLEDQATTLKSNLRQLYGQAAALQQSYKEYEEILGKQHNIQLLNKALNAGQISMIDYFVEVTTLYESRQNHLNVERDYFNTVAQLLQYKL